MGNLPIIPFHGSFAGIWVKPLYNLLDAIRLGNQPHSSSVDRFCLVFPLHQIFPGARDGREPVRRRQLSNCDPIAPY